MDQDVRPYSGSTLPAIVHRVDLSQRDQHLLTVTSRLPASVASSARIRLATWTPGSYLLRNFVHHVQSISAASVGGSPINVTHDGLSAWRLGPATDAVDVTLEIYANDLSVRTNHVDDHHALIIPAATFIEVDGHGDLPQRVEFIGLRPADTVHALLPSDGHGGFLADDYLHLVDSAFDVGDFPVVDFDVDGVPHRFVWSAHGPTPKLDVIASDITAIAQAGQAVFDGPLPMAHYTVLCTGWDQGGGGLEHRDGTVLQIPSTMLSDAGSVPRFQSLLAHEYFHVWNVKRLTPSALVRPNLEGAVFTASLWVAEGWTSYYDKLLPTRAKVWKPRKLIDELTTTYQHLHDSPGATVQALRQASMEAWTKHYVRDENTPNATTDYYGHGGVVAWEIDLRLRHKSGGATALDDVLRLLWARHANSDEGYTEHDILDAVAAVGDDDLAALLERRVAAAVVPEIDDDVVASIGLQMTTTASETPDVGVVVTEDDRGVTIASVLRGRPAWTAGLTGGDRLVAIDGWTVARGGLQRLLSDRQAGETIEVAVTRGPRLLHRSVTLGTPRTQFRLEAVASPSAAADQAFARWSGWPLEALSVPACNAAH